MTLVDLTELFEPYRRLLLEREPGYWIVVGTDGDTVYLRTPDVQTAVRFMRAFAVKHGAELDEQSISEAVEVAEFAAWTRAQELGGEPTAGQPPVSQVGEPASPPSYITAQATAYDRLAELLREDVWSRRVGATVIPFPTDRRRETA